MAVWLPFGSATTTLAVLEHFLATGLKVLTATAAMKFHTFLIKWLSYLIAIKAHFYVNILYLLLDNSTSLLFLFPP